MARVLVADDEPAIREMIQIACELDAHQVLAVTNAQDALAAFGSFAPALLILDVNMPGGGGEHVIRTLRERGISCPAIVVTGLGGAMDDEDRRQMGAAELLSKPFGIDTLRLAVRTTLAARG